MRKMRNLPAMRRVPRGMVGVLLAAAIVLPALSTLAQVPALRVPGQLPLKQKPVHRENMVLSQGDHRLEEIKVELALLADSVTFPYYLGARAVGETLELRGYVPDERVRQRALDLAYRSTILPVDSKVLIQPNLVVPPRQSPLLMLQQEAAELLEQKLGKLALEMSLGVRRDGRIVLAGSIDSAENKLAISRLFRQVAGCRGVVNELIVQSIPRETPPVVQATLKAPMLPTPAPRDARPPAPAAAQPKPGPTVQAPPKPPELLLPVAVPAKPMSKAKKNLVTLPVKILVDQAEPTVQNVWEKRLRQRIEEASDILEQHCGVRLKVMEVGTWESDPKQTKLSELRQDFQKKAAPGKARLVIGFTALPTGKEEDAALGCTHGALQTHILIREWKPRTESERLEVLVHEVGHFLGACHSPESDSVMRPKLGDGRVNLRAFRIRFDPVNTRVMSLITKELARGPMHGLEELSPRIRQRLLDIYAPLARTMPDDPALADAIRRLGGSTRQQEDQATNSAQ